MSLVCGSCTEREKASVETATEVVVVARGSLPTAETEGTEYRSRRSPADRPVVAAKPLLAGVVVEPRGRLTRNVHFEQPGPESREEANMNMPKPKDKPFAIPKSLVWEAYRRVAANKGAPGVDGQALEEFEADLAGNLYKIWNRMSSGSYFPPPVRAVEIPKPHSPGVRVLGVPTIADRIAQTVAARFLEPLVSSRGFTATLMATGREGRPMTRSGYAGSGAGSTTGLSIWMSRNSSTPFPGTSWFVRSRR